MRGKKKVIRRMLRIGDAQQHDDMTMVVVKVR